MKRSGFTLIEVLFTLTLFGMVTILLINLFPASMATVRVSEQRYRAGTLARSLVEQQAALPFSQIPVGMNSNFPSQTIDQVQYGIHLNVTQVGSENTTYLRSLRATVTWTYQNQHRQMDSELLVHHLPSQQ